MAAFIHVTRAAMLGSEGGPVSVNIDQIGAIFTEPPGEAAAASIVLGAARIPTVETHELIMERIRYTLAGERPR